METKLLNLSREIKSQHPIDYESAIVINNIINKRHYESLLEIGTGIGYSSYLFAKFSEIKKITTIEKQMGNFLYAKKFINHPKIEYIWNDCFNYNDDQTFDLIFIDAAKSKYQEMFLKFSNLLNTRGVIVIDNIFLNRVRQKNELSPNSKYQKMIDKVDNFVNWLKDLQNWEVNIIHCGDGLAVCERVL